MEIKLYTTEGKQKGTTTLSEEIFSVKAHPQTINDVVKAQLCNSHIGTVSTKSIGEVSGTTKKMYRQKGTGRARQGSSKSPLHPGGGHTFALTQRVRDQRPPKKIVDKAIKGILSGLARENKVTVVENLGFTSGKTKDVVSFMEKLEVVKAVFVVPEITPETRRAVSNLSKKVKVVTPMNVNAVDMLKFGAVIISDKAIKPLEEVMDR